MNDKTVDKDHADGTKGNHPKQLGIRIARVNLNAFLGAEQHLLSDIAQNLVYQPSNDYSWGFSYLLLFISSILNTLWVLITFRLSESANKHRQTFKVGRRLGMFRAVMDLAVAMKRDLRPNASAGTEWKLRDQLRKSNYGITFEEDSLQISVAERQSFRSSRRDSTVKSSP
jgi:hypothetical protein